MNKHKINYWNEFKINYPFAFFILIALWQFPLSPLFRINMFNDINTMLTMGKALAHGAVPFKDVFEQRGLYMYVIHLVGALPNSLHLLWIIEMINFYFIYRLVIKIFRLNIRIKRPQWWALGTLIVLQFATGINLGASPEEFMLLPNTYAIYIILKHPQGLHEVTNVERFLLTLGLAVIFNIKYSNIGIIGIILVFDLIINYKKAINVLLWDAFGFIVGWLPVLIYFGYNNYLFQFFKVYFIENSQSVHVTSIQDFLIRYSTIIGLNILMTFTMIMFFWFGIRFAIKNSVTYMKYLVYLAFIVELLCVSLIMRLGASYVLSLQWLCILIGCYGLYDLKDSLTSIKWKPINIFLLTATMSFTVGSSAYLLINKQFSNAFALRIISPLQYKSLNKTNNGDVIQSEIVAHHGNGSILAFGYITNNIYLYNKSYPTKAVRYFDQTTIPYTTQPQAADSQYKYVKNAVPKWISMNLPAVTSATQAAYNRKQKSKMLSFVAAITAYNARATKHKQQYQQVRVVDKNLYTVYYFPKVLFKNYILVNVSRNYDNIMNGKMYNTMNLLFLRKSDIKHYPDLKTYHLQPRKVDIK